MMRVRPEQLEALDEGFRAAQRRALIQRFAAAFPAEAHRASHHIGEALMLADAIDFAQADHVFYLAALAQRPGLAEAEGRWARLVDPVLGNVEASPEARIAFLEQEILPRLETERATNPDPEVDDGG